MACRNPECRNGLTPGISITGKGNAKVPVLGAVQRWAWVKCLACNAPQDAAKAGARYRDLHLDADQIAQRAQLATQRAEYRPLQESGLSRVKPLHLGTPTASSVNNEQMAKMLEQISQLNTTVMKLTNQLGDLMEENRQLRKQLENRASAPAPNDRREEIAS